jgi:hypothetical protein
MPRKAQQLKKIRKHEILVKKKARSNHDHSGCFVFENTPEGVKRTCTGCGYSVLDRAAGRFSYEIGQKVELHTTRAGLKFNLG